MIAVPELGAAILGTKGPWPTISGFIGHFELTQEWIAIVVVAVLVWAGFRAIRVTRMQKDSSKEGSNEPRELRRVRGDWLTVAPEWKTVEHPLLLFVIAGVLVLVPSVLVAVFWGSHKFLLGGVIYGTIGLFFIVIPGWVAYKFGQLLPFPTLFATFKKLEERVRLFAVVLASGITVLMIHLILYPWPAVIPDLSRLHDHYRCNPLPPKRAPKDCPKPLTPTPYAP